MKTRFLGFLAVSAGLLIGAVPVFAHHSFSAEFDVKQPVTLKGTVTKVEWTNPHVWIYLDVTDAQGTVQHWQCENGAPNALSRMGWTRHSLNVGDQVTIEGSAPRTTSEQPTPAKLFCPTAARCSAVQPKTAAQAKPRVKSSDQ